MLDETLSRETDFCDNDNHPTLFPLLRVYSYIASAVRGHWTQGGAAAPPPAGDALLLETGDYFLLETGDKLLLDWTFYLTEAGDYYLLETGDKIIAET